MIAKESRRPLSEGRVSVCRRALFFVVVVVPFCARVCGCAVSIVRLNVFMVRFCGVMFGATLSYFGFVLSYFGAFLSYFLVHFRVIFVALSSYFCCVFRLFFMQVSRNF